MTTESTLNEVLINSLVGFEFEFYYDKKSEEASRELQKYLNKDVIVIDKVHSKLEPTDKVFKLEPDYSGGKDLKELITGPLKYNEARLLLISMLKWIDKNAYTTDKCSIHLNISFNSRFANVYRLNVLKFILDFDEDKVYSMFPHRQNSVYAKSIKYVVPRHIDSQPSTSEVSITNYVYPIEKYYGINFSKIAKNYIEFRYIGGKDYQKQVNDILSLLEYFIEFLYSNVSDTEFTALHKIKLDKLINDNKKIHESFKSVDYFIKHFPDIQFTVDLKDDIEILKLYWNKIRVQIIDLLVIGSFSKGLINYDSDTGRLQVKDAKLERIYNIEKLDLISCKLSGNIKKDKTIKYGPYGQRLSVDVTKYTKSGDVKSTRSKKYSQKRWQ